MSTEETTQPEPTADPVPPATPWQKYREALFKHFAETHNLHLLESEMDDIERIVGAHPEILQLRKELAEWKDAFAMFPAPPRALAQQAVADAKVIKDLRAQEVIE